MSHPDRARSRLRRVFTRRYVRGRIRAWRDWVIRQTGAHTRRLLVVLLLLTFNLSLAYHIFEVSLGDARQGYFRTLADIGILLLSGFDVEPPHTVVGWVTAYLLLFTNILFVGTIVQGIGEVILKARGRRLAGTMDTIMKHHTILFGFNRYSRAVMDLYLENTEQYQTRMVLVDEHLPEMPASYAAVPEWIEFVKGNPFDEKTLARANLKSARVAIISPRDDGPAAEADSYAILVALAVERANPDVVSTLILRDRNSRVFLDKNTANGKISVRVDQVICPDEVIENLVANSALNAGLARFILDVVSYDRKEEGGEGGGAGESSGDNVIVVVPAPDDLFPEPGWRDREMPFRTLVDRVLERTGGLVLALQGEDGQEVLPGKPVRVGQRSLLLLRKE